MTTKIMLVVSMLCVLPGAALAQTYYQTQPHACQLATYNCNGNPLNVPGSATAQYSFGGSNTQIVVGGYFAVRVNDPNGEGGRITHIFTQAPPLKNGAHGPFSFGFLLNNGHLGVATGQIKVLQSCHRYCWPYAIVESATVLIE